MMKKTPSKLVIKLFLILGALVAIGCQSNQGVTLDLSSPEKSAEVIMTALQNDDVETFKKCLTSRIIRKVEEKSNFPKFMAIWKKSLRMFSGPADFARGVNFSQENGQWKMDET